MDYLAGLDFPVTVMPRLRGNCGFVGLLYSPMMYAFHRLSCPFPSRFLSRMLFLDIAKGNSICPKVTNSSLLVDFEHISRIIGSFIVNPISCIQILLLSDFQKTLYHHIYSFVCKQGILRVNQFNSPESLQISPSVI